MKQIVLDYKSGETKLVEVPVPALRPGNLLVRNECSAISVGTEKLMTDLARKSLLGKAKARPDLDIADVFVSPSYSEGFSMSILEALARQQPALQPLLRQQYGPLGNYNP